MIYLLSLMDNLIFRCPESKTWCYQKLLMIFNPDSSKKGKKGCRQTIARFLIVWLANFFSICFFCWPDYHSESNFDILKWLIYLDYSYIMSVIFRCRIIWLVGDQNLLYFIMTDFLMFHKFLLQNGGSSKEVVLD